nr:MAG TPA: hypothetical protein [Caudoviricetes sp.]
MSTSLAGTQQSLLEKRVILTQRLVQSVMRT